LKEPLEPAPPPKEPEIEALYREIREAGPRDPRGWALLPPLHLIREVPRRRRFMQRYGWAVPTPEAIDAITAFVHEDRLLEVGAGTGLWAYLLSGRGLSILATDDFSWAGPERGRHASLPSGFAVDPGRFFPVERVDSEAAVKRYADRRGLLLIWPPPDRDMAFLALAAFTGDKAVYVGDPNASADRRFHEELKLRWLLRNRVAIPNWPGIHDAVYLYGRKEQQRVPRAVVRRPNPHLAST
jgi:hypothetical protein